MFKKALTIFKKFAMWRSAAAVCRRGNNRRRLTFETLERRALLDAVPVTVNVAVANFANSTGEMPVGNATVDVKVTNGTITTNDWTTTNSAGACTISVPTGASISAIVTSQGTWQSTPNGSPAQAVHYEVDDAIVDNDGSLGVGAPFKPYSYRSSSTEITQANQAVNVKIDTLSVATVADAFAIFSALQESLSLANSVGAALPPRFAVNWAWGTAGRSGGGAFFDVSGANSGQTIPTIDLPLGSQNHLQSVEHEFGHMVAWKNGFAFGSQAQGGAHYMEDNYRSTASPTEANLQSAFAEGWATYFAVEAADNYGGPSLNVPELAATDAQGVNSKYKGEYDIASKGSKGNGEDNEWSVADVFWRLTNVGVNANLANPNEAGVAPMGIQGLWSLLVTAQPQDVPSLYAAVDANDRAVAGSSLNVNAYYAAIGDLFQQAGVSCVPGTLGTDGIHTGYVFGFTTPPLVTNPPQQNGKFSNGQPATTFQYNQIQILVFDRNWNPVCTFVDDLGPVSPLFYGAVNLTANNGIWTGNVLLDDDGLQAAVKGGGYYWVVQAGAYWSSPVVADASKLAKPTSFEGDPSANDLDLSYMILPPSGAWPTDGSTVTIPSFTVNLYMTTASLDPSSMNSGSLIASYAVTDSEYLDATPDDEGDYDFLKTLDLAASAIDSSTLESLASAGNHFLVAEMVFSDESPSVVARFQGGAFQTTDGQVWVLGGASLDQYWAESADFTTSATIASSDGGVTAVGTIAGDDGTAISYSQAFTTDSSQVNVYAYDNTSTVDGSALASSTSLYALAGDGNDTIAGGQGNDTLIVGGGADTLSDGDGNDTLTTGDGSSVINAGNGNDLLTSGDGNNLVSLGNGDDRVYAGAGMNNVTLGTALANGTYYLSVGDGDNTIAAANGAVTILAANGDNTITAGTGWVQLYLGDGNNVVSVGAHGGYITEYTYSGSVTVGSPGDQIDAGDGDNYIQFGTVAVVSVGSGDNTVYQANPAISGTQISASGGSNTFFMDAESTGLSYVIAGSGSSDLVLTDTPQGTSPTVVDGDIALPGGGTIVCGGGYTGPVALYNGETNNLALDTGGVVYGSNAIPAGTNVTLANGTSLDLVGGSASLGNVILEGGSIMGGSLATSSLTIDSGVVTANLSAGQVTVSGDGNAVLTGTNTYTGGTWIGTSSTDTGTLSVGPDSLGTGTITFVGPGTLQALGDLTLTSAQNIVTPTGQNAVIDANGNNVTLAAVSGGGGLTVTDSTGGFGTVVLAGSDTYAGPTDIEGGVLMIDAGSLPSTAANSIFIDSNGTLLASGPYTTAADWLSHAVISTTSTGTLALTADESAIDMTGYNSLFIGAAGAVTFDGSIMPANDTYMLGGGPGTLTVSSVLADGDDAPSSVVINGSVVFAAANTFSGDTSINNGTLSLANAAALSASGTVTVTGPNSEVQCTVAALIAGNVALNAGGSFDAGSGSEIAGTLTVTSDVDGTRTYVASFWMGTGTVDSEVTVDDGGILNVGQDCPATLIAPSGVLVSGSGQLLTPNVNSTIDGTVDFEGWQTTSEIVGQLAGSDTALVIGASTSYSPAVTLGNIDGIGAVNDFGGGVYVVGGTLIVMSSGGIPTGSLLVIGNPTPFGQSAPALSQDGLGGGDAMLRGGGGDALGLNGAGDGGNDNDGPPDGWTGPLPTSVLAPTVTSIKFDGQPIVNTTSLTFTVDFSEAVTGVVATDFSVVTNGATAAIASVNANGSAAQYTVTVAVSGSGTVDLQFIGGSIANAQGTALYAPELPIASATVTVNPTLYWTGTGAWTSGAGPTNTRRTLANGEPTGWIDGSSIVVAAGSDLQLAGTVHVGSIEFQGAATITGGTIVLVPSAAVSRIIVDSSVAIIDSAIAGGGELAKQGDGVLIVNGAMSYTGGTSVAAGILEALSPLPSAATVTGGQAIVVGSVLATDTAFAALDPALTTLVDTLYARDGEINRADMMQILGSAVVDNAVSDDAEAVLEALTTTAAAAELGEPNYVAVLAADVVQGNAANANYLGAPLGDLASQTSDAARATALTDLLGKWFLGTDLPAASSGSYIVTAGSLYGDGSGPSSQDMAQGGLGDCYLVAAAGSLADSDPAAIENMFIDNGDGTYTVRVYYQTATGVFTPDYVTVNSLLPGYEGANGPTTVYAGEGQDGAWIALLEKAYAQWNETGREGRDGTNSYASLSGGNMGVVDQQITGSAAATYYPSGGSSAEAAIIAAIQSGEAVTAGVFTDGSAQFGSLSLVNDHAYDVVSYDSDPNSPSYGTFTLKNPWGDYEPQPLTGAELAEFSPWVNVAGAGTSGAAGSQPVGAMLGASPAASPATQGLSSATSTSASIKPDASSAAAHDAVFRSGIATPPADAAAWLWIEAPSNQRSDGCLSTRAMDYWLAQGGFSSPASHAGG